MTTRLIEPDEKTFFNVFVVKHIRTSWWIYAWIWFLTLLLFIQGYRDFFPTFMIVFSIIYPIFIIWHFWRFAHSKQNKVFYIPRYYEITDDMLIGRMSDGSNSEIKLEHFIKVYTMTNYSLLFLSKTSFIYMPKNAFDIEIDYDNFINRIKANIKSK